MMIITIIIIFQAREKFSFFILLIWLCVNNFVHFFRVTGIASYCATSGFTCLARWCNRKGVCHTRLKPDITGSLRSFLYVWEGSNRPRQWWRRLSYTLAGYTPSGRVAFLMCLESDKGFAPRAIFAGPKYLWWPQLQVNNTVLLWNN
jgi:hypothetical protein